MEFGHLVFRAALIEFPYPHRLHHRRWPHEPVDGRQRLGTSGVDWSQATKIGETLLVSPLIGFSAAWLLLTILKAVIKIPSLYKEPEGNKPPPVWIRGLLILTCTGVSFFHGGNDGQKGMGLIMLILIGTVPTAYALNRTMHEQDVKTFMAASAQAQTALSHYGLGATPADPRAEVLEMVRTRAVTAQGIPALAAMTATIATQVGDYHSMDKVPARIHGQYSQ